MSTIDLYIKRQKNKSTPLIYTFKENKTLIRKYRKTHWKVTSTKFNKMIQGFSIDIDS